MNNSIESMRIRIHMLEQRDVVRNSKIISKLKRRIRNMESKQS